MRWIRKSARYSPGKREKRKKFVSPHSMQKMMINITIETNSNFLLFIFHHILCLKPQKYQTSDTLPKLYFYFCFEATICRSMQICQGCWYVWFPSIGISGPNWTEKIDLTIVTNRNIRFLFSLPICTNIYIYVRGNRMK